MSQNRSSAVMHQRTEVHDSLDDFPTPPWATRAAIKILRETFKLPTHLMIGREPCANRGHMVRPMLEQFKVVRSSDVHDYGHGIDVLDYLFPGEMIPAAVTMFNSPFNLGVQFIERSFETPGWMVTAALVRTGFLEGVGRYERLYSVRPPTLVAQFSERVIMHKGVLRDPDVEYLDPKTGQWKKPSTATSYCWLFWVKDEPRRPTDWIAPCRKELTREGDYPPPPKDERPITLEAALKRSYSHG